MMTIIGMFSACRRRWALGPGGEDQDVLRGDRKRPPGHGDRRHVLCVQVPAGFWDPAATTEKWCKEIANGRLAMLAILSMFSACRRRLASGIRLRRPT
eukprot:14574075-Heterocapsa_arctica.AAC.1